MPDHSGTAHLVPLADWTRDHRTCRALAPPRGSRRVEDTASLINRDVVRAHQADTKTRDFTHRRPRRDIDNMDVTLRRRAKSARTFLADIRVARATHCVTLPINILHASANPALGRATIDSMVSRPRCHHRCPTLPCRRSTPTSAIIPHGRARREQTVNRGSSLKDPPVPMER